MKSAYLFLAIIATCSTKAQVIKQRALSNYSALQAYSKNFSDILSATFNQASLAQLKSGGFGVYGERRFLLQELSNYNAIVAMPTNSGVFGLEGDYLGSAAFNESQLSVLYGRKISEKVDVGARFNYYEARIPGYGSATSINYDVGVIVHLSDKLHTGIHTYNPSSSTIGKNGLEKLGYVYNWGIGYEVSEMTFISAEIVKQENQPVSVNAGFQYNFQKNIFIRTGISTLSDNSYAAVGIRAGLARIDVNASYHPQLGFTPGLLLLFNLRKKED